MTRALHGLNRGADKHLLIFILSIREVSYKWGVSERRVNQYVTQGRIPGVERFGRSWAIPENAKKHTHLKASEFGLIDLFLVPIMGAYKTETKEAVNQIRRFLLCH